ncbi:MAG: hypothetical protein RBT63_07830 [Bdellovibrionales bacterium]|jgi:chromosome segregation ATPase|nr:hypothetical protein [Bdellovibrionales bacterium]
MSDNKPELPALPTNIPLPTDVPPPPRLSDVPARVLHSATVETLLDHADDLSSRLKVHIRRNASLEGQIVELEETISDSENMRQTLLAQIEILREKDRSVADKQAALELKLKQTTDERDLARLETKEVSRRNQDLQLSQSRAWAYRRRIKRWVRPGIESRDRDNQALKARVLNIEAEILRLTSLNSTLREELAHQRSESDRKLNAAERDRARLVEQYEARITQTDGENQRLGSELTRANDRLQILDRTLQENARTNNERVFFERRAEELDARLKSETERLRGTIDDLAAECATLRASVETAQKLREESDTARNASEEMRVRAENQLRGLREVWQEGSVRLQALEAQNEALEKLNQDLSHRLAEAREQQRIRMNDQALNRVGFAEENVVRTEKLKKLESILTDLEMKAFGIQPSNDKFSSP